MRFGKRHYIGVDLSRSGLQAVSLQRSGRGARITAARSRALPEGSVMPHPREPNLAQPNDLSNLIRELLGPLGGREERLALSLPDSSGRLFLHEMETGFKSREEGLEILRWKLKGALPVAPNEVQLDYQVLNKNENGRYRLLVSAIARPVLEQYEKLFNAAGYQPVVVDFHALNVLGFYQPAIDFSDDLILIVVDGDAMMYQCFQNGQLVWQRQREVGQAVETVFREVNRSVAGSKGVLPGQARARIYLQSDWEQLETLEEAVAAIFERPVQTLDPKLDKLLDGAARLTTRQQRSLVAALGAAGRLM